MSVVKVDNLLYSPDKSSFFFWADKERREFLYVYYINNADMTAEEKNVEEIETPKQMFKVIEFEMDPLASELIIIPIEFTFAKQTRLPKEDINRSGKNLYGLNNDGKVHYEVMVFQENRYQNSIKLLTPIVPALQRKYGLNEDVNLHDVRFIDHPTENLKHVSEYGIYLINRARHVLRTKTSFSGKDLEELFTSRAAILPKTMEDISKLSYYTELLDREKRRRINPNDSTYNKCRFLTFCIPSLFIDKYYNCNYNYNREKRL